MVEIPESLLRRSAEAKAKALGLPVEQVLAEMKGEAPSSTPAEPADAPAAPKPQPGATADVSAPPGEAGTGMGDKKPESPDTAGEEDVSIEAVAEPESMEAGEVHDSTPPPEAASAEEQIGGVATVTETAEAEPTAPPAGDGAPEAPPAPASPAAGNGGGNGKVAAMVSPRPVVPPAGTPEGVRTQRLLTVVKAKAIQQVKPEPQDKVNTWPHLMLVEFVALLAMTAFLVVLSVILQAPLLEPANFNATPNPSKAPWYFLGLQELLSYFDPQIAGVTVPTIIGLVGFMMIPYVDRNPSTKPSDRKFAIMMYTFFLAGSATLTILGVLFRGPGFNFAFPWEVGVFFDDLKDWVHFEGAH